MKILLLSDIHGNWPALQAVLQAEPDANQILCLGDLVNYGPQPVECVAWAMRLNPLSVVIQGSHDRAFGLGTAPHCAPPYQQLAEAMQSATSPLLSPEMKHFLGALQPIQRFPCGETTCVAYHHHTAARDAHFPQPGEQNAQWPWESDIVLLGHAENQFVLVGHPAMLFLSHAHLPMKTNWGNTLVVNPGSVGLPTDGDARAAYAVWEDGMVTLRRAAYDVEETVRALELLTMEEHIRQRLVEMLRTGGRLATYPAAELAAGR
jgi:predicted phosphodiesterase